MSKKPELIPFGIHTSRDHYVVMQAYTLKDATMRYQKEESHRGTIVSIKKVE